jgi:hypothetical protein
MGSFALAFLDLSILLSDLSILGSFVALYLQVKSRKSALGLSLQTVGAVAMARVLHLLSHPLGIHFRPDTLPFIVYWLLDYANAAAGVFVLYFITSQYVNTYESEKDNFSQNFWLKLGIDKGTVQKLRWVFLYLIAGIFGFIWHLVRRSHHTFLVSYFCCYYEALCALALLPQLWMFQQDRVVSPQLANFVALTACNRLFTLIFWISYPYVFWNRYPDNRGVQMASEILNLLILSDFLYYFVKARLRGQQVVVIPQGLNEV